MFYILILESIGTSELILISLVALIIFGPRKLPEFARTLGKMMSEFRRSTDDFKETWAREVEFESEEKNIGTKQIKAPENAKGLENTVSIDEKIAQNEIQLPGIKEVSQTEMQRINLDSEIQPQDKPEKKGMDKRNWL